MASNMVHPAICLCVTHYVSLFKSCTLKPMTDIARDLLAIDLRLDVRNYCNGLQQKFQHAEYFTCDSLITQPTVIGFSNGFHYYSQEFITFPMIAHTIWCDDYFYLPSQVIHHKYTITDAPSQAQGMPDVARVIIASKRCTSYSVVVKSQAKRAFTCNVCQGLKHRPRTTIL